MNKKSDGLEQKLIFFKEKLDLGDIELIIRNSIRTGIHFDEDIDCYIINYNDQGVDYALAHELGHILLSKKTNCATFVNPPVSDDVDDTIFTILDYLINVIVNSLVSRINNLYEYYQSFFSFYINLKFGFRNATELVALNISTKLEYQFNLKPRDKDISLIMKMAGYYNMLKNQPGFNRRKYDNILPQLYKYNEIISKLDLQNIIDFLFEITCLICENFNYMEKDNIINQFQIFFPNNFR